MCEDLDILPVTPPSASPPLDIIADINQSHLGLLSLPQITFPDSYELDNLNKIQTLLHEKPGLVNDCISPAIGGNLVFKVLDKNIVADLKVNIYNFGNPAYYSGISNEQLCLSLDLKSDILIFQWKNHKY